MKICEWYNPVITKLQRAVDTQMFNHRTKNKQTNKQTNNFCLAGIC